MKELAALKRYIDVKQRLIATHYEGENPEIRRAFIFCLYCGLRWCDVKDLTFAKVGLLQAAAEV